MAANQGREALGLPSRGEECSHIQGHFPEGLVGPFPRAIELLGVTTLERFSSFQ